MPKTPLKGFTHQKCLEILEFDPKQYPTENLLPSQEEITKAYRKLSIQMHPDTLARNSTTPPTTDSINERNDKFSELNNAYRCLLDKNFDHSGDEELEEND